MPSAEPCSTIAAVRLWLGLLAVSAVLAAPPTQQDFEAWALSQGGRVERSADGSIAGVDLSGTWITDADLSRIAALGRLERLDLSETGVSDVGLEALAPLRGVRELNLYFAEAVSEFGLANLKGWTSLQKLNLRGTQARSRVFETLAELGGLRELDLSHTRVTDDGFDRLAELQRLETLAIGSNRLDGGCLETLKLLPNLRRLDLRGVQRVDSGLWGLALNRRNLERLSELKQLRELLLGGATITDVGADRPGRQDAERAELLHVELLASLKQLRELDLSRQPVTLAGIAFLRELPALERLNLGQCARLGDPLADLLAALPRLREAYLAGTGLSDAGLQRLGALRLQRLSVGGSAVTEAAVAAFRAGHPQVELTWFGSDGFGETRAAQ